MKKLIQLAAAIFLALTFTGCLTVNKIKRHCDDFAKVCITNTETITETIYRDTTVYLTDTVLIKLPADTVTITDTVTVDAEGLAWLPPVYREFGLVWVTAGVKASILNVSAGLTDSTFLTPMHDTITIENAIQQQTATTTNTMAPERVKFIPGFYRFTFWLFIVEVLAALVYIATRLTPVIKLFKKLTSK